MNRRISSKKKVYILTSAHSVFDVRIFHKEAKTLAEQGYKVTLIAQYDKEEMIDGIEIIPLPKAKNRFRRMAWLPLIIFKLALREEASVYHFHDPELVPLGVLLRLLGKKVVYDVHEDVSRQILNKPWIFQRLRKLAAGLAYIAEQAGACVFNKIIVAVEDLEKKFYKDKVVVLRNFPVLEIIGAVKPINAKRKKSIIIYAGGLSENRGIKEVIEAMDLVAGEAILRLLGRWEVDSFKRQCEVLSGWKRTEYLGTMIPDKVYQHMKLADIGISVLRPAKQYLFSLPTKVFEYMACSLPVIMSDFPYWRKIFGECALFVNPNDTKDIADKILYLLKNPGEAERLGKKGRRMVEQGYNWEEEKKKLINLYNELL